MNRVTTFDSLMEMKEAGWIPAQNILSWINDQVGFRVHKSEDSPDYPDLEFAVIKDRYSIQLGIVERIDIEGNIYSYSDQNLVKIEVQMIFLAKEKNVLNKPGCFISAYHRDDLNEIILSPCIVAEMLRREEHYIATQKAMAEKYAVTRYTYPEFFRWVTEDLADLEKCPKEVYNQKVISGLSWKQFKKSFERRV